MNVVSAVRTAKAESEQELWLPARLEDALTIHLEAIIEHASIRRATARQNRHSPPPVSSRRAGNHASTCSATCRSLPTVAVAQFRISLR